MSICLGALAQRSSPGRLICSMGLCPRSSHCFSSSAAPVQLGKTEQTRFCISIKWFSRPIKSVPNILRNDEKAAVRPHVQLTKSQYEQLKELKEKTGKPVSEMIREAVSRSVEKKGYPVSMVSSYLPRASRMG